MRYSCRRRDSFKGSEWHCRLKGLLKGMWSPLPFENARECESPSSDLAPARVSSRNATAGLIKFIKVGGPPCLNEGAVANCITLSRESSPIIRIHKPDPTESRILPLGLAAVMDSGGQTRFYKRRTAGSSPSYILRLVMSRRRL